MNVGKMKKTIIITLLLSVFCSSVFSQNERKLSKEEKVVFEQKMLEQSKKIKTLQCNFIQEKTSQLIADKAVSKGFLLYESPSKLRWEYAEPTVSTLILNGKNAVLLDKMGKPIGNVNMLKQLGNIIISMINGDGLQQNKQFSTEVFETDNKLILVVLTPVQKRMKEFYDSIELKIDQKTFLASEISMNEKSGDKMRIYFNNKKTNETISADKFAVK